MNQPEAPARALFRWSTSPRWRFGLVAGFRVAAICMIVLVDDDAADARALQHAFQRAGARAEVADSVEVVLRAAHLVVSGTGPFPKLVRDLRDRALVRPLMRALQQGRPFLGIGVGLHLLFDVSYEGGQHTGLGVIPGKVLALDCDGRDLVERQHKVPHLGWNHVYWSDGCPLVAGLESGESFFFNHSAHAQPLDERVVAGRARHAHDFAALVWSGRMFATQFLPHRSQEAGLKVLANFAGMR